MKTRNLVGAAAVVLFTIGSTAPAAFAQPRRIEAQPEPNRGLPERHDDHRNEAPPANVAPPGYGPGQVGHVDPRNDTSVQHEREEHEKALKDKAAWDRDRSKRQEEHRKEVSSTYGNAANSAAGRAELATNADRMARLNRIYDVAQQNGDTAMEARAQAAMSNEMSRHEAAMAAIKAGQ